MLRRFLRRMRSWDRGVVPTNLCRLSQDQSTCGSCDHRRSRTGLRVDLERRCRSDQELDCTLRRGNARSLRRWRIHCWRKNPRRSESIRPGTLDVDDVGTAVARALLSVWRRGLRGERRFGDSQRSHSIPKEPREPERVGKRLPRDNLQYGEDELSLILTWHARDRQ